MPSSDRFRRPREPDLTDYWDRLEKRLRAEMHGERRRARCGTGR